MKKLAVFCVCLFTTFALFSQSVRSINANFEVDKQGWTSGNSVGVVEWSDLFPPMAHRSGISFSGENKDGSLFLFIQKEVTDLLPNTNYHVKFNMNWVCRMEVSAPPIFVKVGATNQEPEIIDAICLLTEELRFFTSFDKGEIGQNSRDFTVAGQLTPDKYGRPFLQNVNNFDNAFSVNTDDEGRLFLMIGLEPKSGDIEHIYLNTLRILLAENGEARESPTNNN